MPRKYPTGGRVRVYDPPGLLETFRWLMDEYFGGNISQASRVTGVSQPTLSRLYTTPRRFVFYSIIQAILAVIDAEEDAPVLLEKVYEPYHDAALTLHREWVGWRLSGLLARPGAKALLRRIQAEAPHVWNPWMRMRKARTFSAARLDMALARVIEPLLDSEDGEGIELCSSEMATEQFSEFVELRWKSEKMLLDRANDSERAQDVGHVDLDVERPWQKKPEPLWHQGRSFHDKQVVFTVKQPKGLREATRDQQRKSSLIISRKEVPRRQIGEQALNALRSKPARGQPRSRR